ncbi:MAG TPA: hypothetical protein PKD10_15315 [Paracoccaceae bacterium]|nr:hypothetical protein [Paracoccaceae bacterium]HMO71539.1 hypothetical protein [Paracoccaceae bacterium]
MHIVVLSLERVRPLAAVSTPGQRWHHLIEPVAQVIRELGHSVTFRDITEPYLPADAAILHPDLTVVPPFARRLAARYPVCLNAATHDISKRATSRNVLTRDGDWTGPVIVKSDLNCSGLSERGLNMGARRAGLAPPFPAMPPIRALTEYRVFTSLAAVPATVWDNPYWVVEAFRPERRPDGLHVVRIWYFAGDWETTRLIVSPHPVVKGPGSRYEGPCEVPADIRAERVRLGFDYGKFDFGIAGDGPALYDANRTPAYVARVKEAYGPMIPGIAAGLLGAIAARQAGANTASGQSAAPG